MANHGEWWQTPQLLLAQDDHEERRVSWLELFYDLMFVVVIAELSHYLAEHPTMEGVLSYILLFVPVWWVWIGGTFYNARFETQDVSFRLTTFLQMLPVGLMTLFIHDGLGETSIPFALSYIAARIIITGLWARAGWHTPLFRPVTNRYVAGFTLSILLWTISLVVPPPWRFVLWAIGLVNDLVTPLFTLKYQAQLPRLSNSKLPERFGLFVIIVLGEQLVGAISGAAEQEPLVPITLVTLLLGILFAFCIWWVYFDYIARRVPRPSVFWSFGWAYLHMPLLMSIAALGAGSLVLIADADALLSDSIRWLFAGATALVLVTMALIEATLRPDPTEPTQFRTSIGMKSIGAVVALGLGAIGGSLGQLAFFFLMLIPFLLQMIYGGYVWFRRDASGDEGKP
jgi:low temperature requirement protein LtrA